MKRTISLVIISLLAASTTHATEHHSGHGGGGEGGGGTAGTCVKPHLAKFQPAHLATVAPESEISFIALNVHKPEQISVTVKNMPVEINTEFKDPYYLVKAKLPVGLHNTAARINIKVSAKTPRCEVENGWLLKISE
jgi:hypothetical protein